MSAPNADPATGVHDQWYSWDVPNAPVRIRMDKQLGLRLHAAVTEAFHSVERREIRGVLLGRVVFADTKPLLEIVDFQSIPCGSGGRYVPFRSVLGIFEEHCTAGEFGPRGANTPYTVGYPHPE